MKRAALVVLLLLAEAGSSGAAPAAVDFVNASRATHCAEEDNVYVKVQGPRITAFRIRAEHPPYIGTVTADSTAPDFTACDMSQDPSFPFAPRKVLLYEDARIRLVGHTFPSFWRPEVVAFSVGGKNEPGLHLVQLLKRGPRRDIEILVVYPADGYWRLKPLPPPALEDSAYGSSFLFGPVEEEGRPFVAIRAIAFDPATLTFRLAFRNETRGQLKVVEASRARTSLALKLDPPAAADRPFAALRSMYVTSAQADVAVAAWSAGASGPRSAPILEFQGINAASVRFGRVEPSLHNLSAPDVVFHNFATASSR
jgi:hypothetical protein